MESRLGSSIVAAVAVGVCLSVPADTEGWRNECTGRELPRPAKELWRAEFGQGLEGFQVEWRAGATGEVSVAVRGGRRCLAVDKRNAQGYVLVKANTGLAPTARMKLQTTAGCEADDADSELSYGFLAVWSGKEDLSDRTTGPYGRGGPKMTHIANTPPGFPDRKLAYGEADGTNGVWAAIVVAGAESRSYWSGWTVADRAAEDAAWREKVRGRKPPAANGGKEMSEEEFDALLANAPDHTAKVVRRDGCAKFLVDGEVKAPVFYKGSTSYSTKGFYGGAKLAKEGVDLQSVSVRLGATKQPEQGRGFWTKDGFDAKGAADLVRKGMMKAPHAKYLLTVNVSAYPEFCDEHPDEVWVNDWGRKVFGHDCHSQFSLPKEMNPARHWLWASNHSLVWREAAKACLTELIAELKRTGLAKMIVGVHLAGYHDGQFATVHPDCSKPAVAAFRRWLAGKYGSVDALRKAWHDAGVTFDTATPPPRLTRYRYGDHPYWDADSERPAADFAAFLKEGPFRAQEDLSRHVKRCFGKDIVTVRYCMSPFGGTFCSAYDIVPFLKSDTFDILCAQPNYGRRVPGMACATPLPLDSFHAHGKMYFDEFDLRTYGALTGWETELATLSYSKATDDPMFASVNRKLAGQMIANRMGWWYYDMAGGWYEPDGIAADIAATREVVRRMEGTKPGVWRPDVAFAVDESGALLRNTQMQYFNPDETTAIALQMNALAAAGVPHDSWALEDWLENPALADRYRTVVIWGMYNVDAARRRLLERLCGTRRTIVLMAGSGRSGGGDALGFRLGSKRAPAQHGMHAADGVPWRMASLMQECKAVKYLGVKDGWLWLLNSPPRLYLEEAPGQKVVARFDEDGTAAVAERAEGAAKLVYVAAYGGLTPDYFRHLVEEAGGYVPSAKMGLQIDMNGNFMSVHCLKAGSYEIRLPFAADVLNLKTGVTAATAARSMKMDLEACETRWHQLIPACRSQP